MRVTRRATVGNLLTHGIIELVSDRAHDGRLRLLVWNGTRAYIADSVTEKVQPPSAPESEREKIEYVPVDIDLTVRRSIRFAERADSFDSSRKLFDDLCGVIKLYTELPERFVFLVAHVVRASWFSDYSDSWISLAITGPPSYQGQQLFRLLLCLCRRPLLLAEVSLPALCALPMDLCPSLFIDRSDFSPQLQRVLRATQARGHVAWKGKLVRTRCTTVVCTDVSLNYPGSGWSGIEIPAIPTCPALPVLTQHIEQRIADEFQPKLLMYRVSNHRQVMDSAFDVPAFTPPVRDVARYLGACVVDDPDLQAGIVNLMKEEDEQVHEAFSADLVRIVLDAMLRLCHKPDKASAFVGEITTAANEILEQRGEALELKPRLVGSKLRLLGLATTRLDASGRGILLLDSVRKRIHEMAWSNGVLGSDGDQSVCDHCDDLLAEQELERRDSKRIEQISIEPDSSAG